MAGYSSRQSSFATGDTITAAHSNDEFNQILAAFNASTGHTHDGTAGEGGPITTIRDANTLNRVLVDSSNNHLEFYINVSSSSVQQFRLQDGAIVPITNNDIDLGTSSLEFKDLFIDGTANVDTLAADAISLGGTTITSTAAELNILDGVTSTAAELNILDGVTSTAAELNILDGVTSTAAELNILDGVTATAAEINLIDGGTSRGTTAVANGDGFLHNDGGTMRMTNVSKMADLFAGTGIDASSAVLSVAAAQTGITSIFATDLKLGEDDQTKIDFETANQIHFYLNNAKDFSMTANTFTAESGSSIVVPAGGLTIGSTAVDATAAELNILDGVTASTSELNIMDGVTATTAELNIMDGVTSTTAELNLMDGGTSATSTTLASADRFVCNDNGTMKQVALSDLVTYLEDGGTSGFNVDGGTYS